MIPIVQDIVSVFFVLALGYFSGKRSMFTQDQAEGMNHLDCLIIPHRERTPVRGGRANVDRCRPLVQQLVAEFQGIRHDHALLSND